MRERERKKENERERERKKVGERKDATYRQPTQLTKKEEKRAAKIDREVDDIAKSTHKSPSKTKKKNFKKYEVDLLQDITRTTFPPLPPLHFLFPPSRFSTLYSTPLPPTRDIQDQ